MSCKLYPSELREYYLLRARCINQRNESFWLDWDLSEGSEMITDEDGDVTDFDNIAQFYADRVLNQQGYVIFYKEQLKKQAAPLCFSLASLQEATFNLFDYEGDEVIEITQSLHKRHKAISYPHTDCEYLPECQLLEASNVLSTLKMVYPSLAALINRRSGTQQSMVWNDKKITGHHAIIPASNSHVLLNTMSAAEKNVYELILRRYIAQFFDKYEYIEKRASCMIYDEPFVRSFSTPLANGWAELFLDYEEQPDAEGLPQLFENETIVCQEVRIEKHYKICWSRRRGSPI